MITKTTTKHWLQAMTFALLACTSTVGCTADSSDAEDDDSEENVGMQQSAQAKDETPSKEGKGCSATSTIRSTRVPNGTYTSNGSGGYNCCSRAGENQVCINCAATGTNTCTDKAKRVSPTPVVVAPIKTFAVSR